MKRCAKHAHERERTSWPGGPMTLAGMSAGDDDNTPVTDSAKPAATATRCRHTRRQPIANTCSNEWTMRRSRSCMPTACIAATGSEDSDLAPVPGGARRSRHLLRPALRPQPRDARCPRGDHHACRRCRSGRAGRDSALHEAVLAEHRSAQQPDRPKVRPEMQSGSARVSGARRRSIRRNLSAQGRRVGRRRCWPGSSRCSSIPRSTQS